MINICGMATNHVPLPPPKKGEKKKEKRAFWELGC